MKVTSDPELDILIQVRIDEHGRSTVMSTASGEHPKYQHFVLRQAGHAIRHACLALETRRQCRTCSYCPRSPDGRCVPSGKHPRDFAYKRLCDFWQPRETVVVFDPDQTRRKRKQTSTMS